jgi:GrpB-like predicted nucleotidyltransferase (UPF0157 family)
LPHWFAGGYKHEGDLGITGREPFQAPAVAPHYHHLYIVVAGSKAAPGPRRTASSPARDPDDRARYAARKHELAGLLQTDCAAYVDGKATLIEEMLSSAQAEPLR